MTRGRRACAIVGAGASIVLAAPAASAACPVTVEGETTPSWSDAVVALRARLGRADGLGDCASVHLAISTAGGALTFSTIDGRSARRDVATPEELAPTVEALLVNPPPPPLPPAAPDSVSSTSPRPGPEPKPSPEVHFNVAATGGGRLGFSGAYGAPTLGLRPSGTFGAWELAGAVEYDPTFVYLPGGLPSGVSLWSFAATLQIGRREALGFVSLGYGGGVGVAALREEAPDASGARKVADFGQPRLGGYARVTLPRESRWRGTMDLGFDAGLGSIKRRATESSNLPDLPRWGVGLGLGVEVSLL